MHDHENEDPKTNTDEQTPVEPEPSNEVDRTSTVGDHVLDILSGVEQQFDRMRQVQQGHDTELKSLKEHTEALEKAEQEAREEVARLREQRVALERQRGELEERESAVRHEAERVGALEARIAIEHEEIESERKSIDEIRQKLTEDRHEHDRKQHEHFNELQSLEEELTKDRLELESERKQAQDERMGWEQTRQEREQGVAQREADVERSRAALEQRERDVQSDADHVRELKTQVAERTAEIEQQQEEIAKTREALERKSEENQRQIEAARQELEEIKATSAERVQAAEAQAQSAEARAETVQASFVEAKAEAKTATELMESETTEMRTQLEQTTAQLTDAESKLALAGDRLSKFGSILAEQAPQLEKGTAALAMVEHQRNQIERLTRQVAEANVGGAMEELKRKEERIAELTEALRQSRGQNAGDQDVGALESRVAELLEQVEQHKVEAEQAKTTAEEAHKQLDDRVEQTVRDNLNEVAVAEQETRNVALSAELESVQKTLDEQENAEQVLVERADALEERVRELTDALEDARTIPAEESSESAGEAMDHLREKARRVNAVAEHLRRRQTRLKKMHRLLEKREKTEKSQPKKSSGPIAREQQIANMEQRAAEIRQLESQRKHLSEVRAMLASSESAMMRKWARPRSIGAVVWLFLLVAMNAAIAWFTTDYLFPAEVSASVSLSAQTRGDVKMSEDEAAQWVAWHADLVGSSDFNEAVAKRMAERRLDQYRTAQAVEVRLHNNLSVEKTNPETLTLSLSGNNDDEVTGVLDIVALTLSAESTRQMGKRNDRARAVVNGEHQEAGLIRYASLNPVAISDERLKYVGPVFGVLMVISLVLILAIYSHLIRAKRVFDEESAMIEAGELPENPAIPV